MLKQLVVKVGTNVLTRPDGRLDLTNISHVVDQLAELKAQGIRLVLVSSGAVGAGRELLPEADALDTVERRQMLSAIGQVRLMELYRQFFAGHNLRCAQVLATKSDFRDDLHRQNMLNCFRALLQHEAVVPVVNENDVVAVTELMFTDNDELAGLVAQMLELDALVILSSVSGLYDGPPDDADSKLVARVKATDDNVMQLVQTKKSSLGRGGMGSKLSTALKAAQSGVKVYLGHGRERDILSKLADNDWPGTIIL